MNSGSPTTCRRPTWQLSLRLGHHPPVGNSSAWKQWWPRPRWSVLWGSLSFKTTNRNSTKKKCEYIFYFHLPVFPSQNSFLPPGHAKECCVCWVMSRNIHPWLDHVIISHCPAYNRRLHWKPGEVVELIIYNKHILFTNLKTDGWWAAGLNQGSIAWVT